MYAHIHVCTRTYTHLESHLTIGSEFARILCVHVCIYMHIHTHIHIHMQIHAYTCMHTNADLRPLVANSRVSYTCACVCVQVNVFIYMYIHIYTHIQMRTTDHWWRVLHVCMCISIRIHIYVNTHIHTHKRRPLVANSHALIRVYVYTHTYYTYVHTHIHSHKLRPQTIGGEFARIFQPQR